MASSALSANAEPSRNWEAVRSRARALKAASGGTQVAAKAANQVSRKFIEQFFAQGEAWSLAVGIPSFGLGFILFWLLASIEIFFLPWVYRKLTGLDWKMTLTKKITLLPLYALVSFVFIIVIGFFLYLKDNPAEACTILTAAVAQEIAPSFGWGLVLPCGVAKVLDVTSQGFGQSNETNSLTNIDAPYWERMGAATRGP